MKFSSSLKFNAVPEWWDEYIAYDALKKYIYQLEKQQQEAIRQAHDLESATEQTSLVGGPGQLPDTDALFKPPLDAELRKISSFYAYKERELLEELRELEDLVAEQDELGLLADGLYPEGDVDWIDDDDDDEDEWPASERSRGRPGTGSRRRRRVSSSVGRGPISPTHNHMKEVTSPRARRVSISSTEENAELEASLASLRRHSYAQPPTVPEAEEMPPGPSRPTSVSRSKSPGKARALASKLRSSIASLTPHIGRGPLDEGGETIWTSKSNYATDTQLLFKRRITNLYVQISALRSYLELNYSGFRKILKKYDKVTESSLQNHYLHDILEHTPPFDQASRIRLSDAQSHLLHLYAKCVTHGDVAAAQRQLKLHLREHIAWERDTVWRQMIGRERRGEAGTPLGMTVGAEEKGMEMKTPLGKIRVTRRSLWTLGSVLVFVILLNVHTINGPSANRCFAILVFATLLWASEAIPLFVTSLMIPLLLVMLRVVRPPDGGEVLTPKDSAKWVFSVMFSPTIMLLLGGFTIAAALSKTNIDRILVTRVLSLAGTKPNTVILTVMCVACFASMWISNVAAPTLCLTLVRPILRTLPPKASFGPCLILAIALAANIGGQSSPISSPQNLIALSAMDPPVDWAQWFAVALPVSALSIVLIWLLLIVSYRPSHLPTGDGYLEIKALRPTKEGFSKKQWFVVGVSVITITLWVVEKVIEKWVGDMGVIAIIPIVAFFGTGVLKKDDFEQFLWTVVFLAMGGIALGQGVTSSGLFEQMDTVIRDLVEGLSLFTVVLVLSLIVLVVSTFISHTIASVLLVPIAKEVGGHLPGDQSNLLIFITGLVCSAGMGMPVSGFPNQTAATQEDEMGQLYLSNVDFLKNGIPASIIATLVVAFFGFALMKLIGI